MARLALLTILLFGLATPAWAHDPGMSAATLVVDARSTTIELSVKGSDLEKLTGIALLDSDGKIDAERLAHAGAAIRAHLLATTELEADAESCPLAVVELVAAADGLLAVLEAPCGRETAGLAYRTSLLQGLNPQTIQHVLLLEGEDARPAALTRENDSVEIAAPLPLNEVALHYLAWGAEHIFIGYDHIAFILALLLWARRVWGVVKVVTAFTVSHSITLSLAALDVVRLPGGLVEPLIAASIVVVALENFLDRRVERRWRMAFVLGFLHGFGFAGVLAELGLPRDSLLIALGFFNLGVEVGQVAIVSLAVPALLLLDRVTARGPAEPARRPAVVYGLSAPIACLGAYWLIERTFLA
ncbi:MAG TPA: HupE/UreJ family protein [Kiloniellales bacterium]|nr:HupE/UreJ family protein [Kiloniellales bacterium]